MIDNPENRAIVSEYFQGCTSYYLKPIALKQSTNSETCDDIDSSDGFKSIVAVIVPELCERWI